jgi:alcohol dehydrogenase class IV
LSNALLLPHVLRFNAPACGSRYAELLPHAFPERAGGGADAFVEAVEELGRACGLQPRLRDVGIPADAVPMMAQDAMRQTRLLVNNPRPVTLEDARAIYEAAW